MTTPSRPDAAGRATMITFPPSLDCELGRFLLVRYGIPYTERRHTILFNFLATLWHARTLRFPVLYDGGYPTLDATRKMIDYFDPIARDARKLLRPGADGAQIEADWAQFNGTLGGAVAVFAYFHLLPHRAIMLRPLSEGTPAGEVLAVRLCYPLFAAFLRFALKLSPANVAAALTQIRQVVQSIDERLADGRLYLVGDRLTLSDVALANALSPLVLPPETEAPLPALAEMPPELQAVVKEMQSRPAGQFALRIYREYRRRA
jgi:glutathione S-transferase